VNLPGVNTDNIKKNTETAKEAGLEINVQMTASSPDCRSKSIHKNSKQII
jgi:hypothetical protein